MKRLALMFVFGIFATSLVGCGDSGSVPTAPKIDAEAAAAEAAAKPQQKGGMQVDLAD